MIRDTFLNFFVSEHLDYGFDAFESKFNPRLDLNSAVAGHFALNAIFALQGYFAQWKRPENTQDLTKTIVLPILVGLGSTVISNTLKGRSNTTGMSDLALHSFFFAAYRIYFHNQGYDPKHQWYNQVLMGGSFVLGVLTLAKKCARYMLQQMRDPKFPSYVHCSYEIAKSSATFTITNLAERYNVGASDRMVRNLTILHLVSIALIFPIETLSGVKMGHNPLQMTKTFVIFAGSFSLLLGNNAPS